MRLARRLRDERGTSLVELLAVAAVLGIVLATLGTVLVRVSHAQLDVAARLRAQGDARTALDRLRRDVHCASAAATNGAEVVLTLPGGCPAGASTVRWCAVGAAAPFGLYRSTGATCDASGIRWAADLSGSTLFTVVTAAGLLTRLHVELPVGVPGSRDARTYRLVDDLVLRNSVRP